LGFVAEKQILAYLRLFKILCEYVLNSNVNNI